jgi:hypothetical protein
MIGLIPLISDDILLTGLYIIISFIALKIQKEKHDLLIYSIGFCFMLISEALFISTGVETFQRRSLFGIMPLWLPFLWAYGFIAIRRAIHIIEK